MSLGLRRRKDSPAKQHEYREYQCPSSDIARYPCQVVESLWVEPVK
jgi:hypothetical protein